MLEPDQDMQIKYRNAFGTQVGRAVLGDILCMCHFGETLDPNDPVRVAEYNVGIVIARMAGALDLVYPQVGIAVKENGNGSSDSTIL